MKRFRRVLLIILAISLVIVMVAGCGTDDDAEVIEVIIGYTAPLSGPAAEYGQDGLNGVEMAINEINEAGGITIDGQQYIFKLESMDDMADPTMSRTNTERLADRGAIAVFNPVMTGIYPMMEINTEESAEFIVMAYSSTPAELETPNDLTIYIPPPFVVYVQSMSAMARSIGWETGAMVVTAGAYGDAWRGIFSASWEAMGGTITEDQPVQYYGEVDYSTQLTAAIATEPDFMLIGGPSGPTALVVEQARQLGFNGGFIFIDQAKLDYVEKVLGGLEMLEGAIGVIPPPHAPYGRMPSFDQSYDELYVQQEDALVTTWESALQYTATYALVQAMELAGSVDDPYAIRAVYADVFPLMGADYPGEYHGLTDQGRMMLLASITMVSDGDYLPATPVLWWPRSEEAFADALDKITRDPNVPDEDVLWIPFPPLQ